MKKLRISIGFKARTDMELSEFTSVIIDSLTGNPYFPDPHPSIVFMEDLKSRYDHWMIKALDGSRTDTTTKKELRIELRNNLTALRHYVEDNCLGSESILISSGFDLRKGTSSNSLLLAPHNIILRDGIHSGEIIVSFKKPEKSKSFLVRYNYELGSGNWITLEPTAKNKIILAGLEIGKDIWVEVKAVYPNGISDWSNPVVLRMVR